MQQKKFLKKIKNKKNRKARFVCSLTIFWPSGKKYTVESFIKGKIINTKRGKKGFGYDPIFVPNGYNKTFGEMKPKSKILIDHRFKAFKKIKKFF